MLSYRALFWSGTSICYVTIYSMSCNPHHALEIDKKISILQKGFIITFWQSQRETKLVYNISLLIPDSPFSDAHHPMNFCVIIHYCVSIDYENVLDLLDYPFHHGYVIISIDFVAWTGHWFLCKHGTLACSFFMINKFSFHI